jgi:ABC-2 type transport system permease protein
MRRITATILKEWHTLRRDLSGLALLFIMPVMLIIIMALVQDAPFKDYRDVKYDVLFLNEDHGKVAQFLEKGLSESKQFNLIVELNGKPLTEGLMKEKIQKGYYSIGIVIPKGTTAEIVNSANVMANEMGKYMGIGHTLPHRESRDQVSIQVLFDPVSKPTFRMAMLNAVEKFTAKVQSEIIIDRISKLNQQSNSSDTASFDMEKHLNAVKVKEMSTSSEPKLAQKMNSVQHNVPAWAIFGMFFMIMVIAESMINERIQGSWTRLKLIPGSQLHVLFGKTSFYILLALCQFLVMMWVGIYVMPLFGLPSLVIPNAYFSLLWMVFSIALCATSMGLLIGTSFRTTNQALPVAAISVVILSAIGGVWVPVEVLPPSLKIISVISPMRWALSGINSVLIREVEFAELLLPSGLLLLGSAICLGAAWLIERFRTQE